MIEYLVWREIIFDKVGIPVFAFQSRYYGMTAFVNLVGIYAAYCWKLA